MTGLAYPFTKAAGNSLAEPRRQAAPMGDLQSRPVFFIPENKTPAAAGAPSKEIGIRLDATPFN